MSNKDLLDNIKKLREMTWVGFKDCKAALDDSKGDIEKSIEYIDYELRYNNSNTKALKWQIRTLFEQGNYADAELYANRLIAINPKSPDGYAILGDIKLLMGKISESNDLHSKVIEIAPNYKIATKKKLN